MGHLGVEPVWDAMRDGEAAAGCSAAMGSWVVPLWRECSCEVMPSQLDEAWWGFEAVDWRAAKGQR